MPKQLPTPRFISAEPTIVSSSIDQRSATGSNRQKGMRKGSHYSFEMALEPMSHAEALTWLDLRNEADTVIIDVPQMGLEIGTPGTTLVNGSGHAGANLPIKGFTPGYVVRKGQAFNHIGSDGVRRIYVAASAVTATDGTATVPLETMLNWPVTNNEVVTFSDVRIEGFAAVERGSFLQDGDGWHHIRFTVEEPG
ncbi:hypothetical protein HNP47_000861 [Brevundimonas vesicularis]|uniref:Uncharacterized protein n=1 Tax=Brevundimonas vesicularis TaxID=41276 RepID=A0A7W9L516_BREVE|nr:hypothetical protein [Brevundimonas vesicularis]MBB5770892.1 hypothetical protein [Brevundimonas vesicularis]